MRDLAADLKICEAATHGPWEAAAQGGVSINDGARNYYELEKIFLRRQKTRREDAKFIAESREGWPEAIKRAIEAESEVERLRQHLAKVEAGAVAMREAVALLNCMVFCGEKHSKVSQAVVERAFSSNAGADMLKRIRKLEAVAEAAEWVLMSITHIGFDNGVSAYGVDEGEENARKVCRKLDKALAASKEGGQAND